MFAIAFNYVSLFTSILESEEGGSDSSSAEEVCWELFAQQRVHHWTAFLESTSLPSFGSGSSFIQTPEFLYQQEAIHCWRWFLLSFLCKLFSLNFLRCHFRTLVRAITYFTSRFSKLCVVGLEFFSVLASWIFSLTSRTTSTKFLLFLFHSSVVGMKTTRLLWRCVELCTSLLSCTKNRFLACATPYLLSFFPVRLLRWLHLTQFVWLVLMGRVLLSRSITPTLVISL